jgi:hypothetical protein
MITADETLRVRRIRKMAEDGQADFVSKEDRQWILDLHKREGIPMESSVMNGAKEAGFDVEGIKVKDND